jgi:hypothetical protein
MGARTLPVELIHTSLTPLTQQQLVRLYNDTEALRARLSKAEARTAYPFIERARDNLSAILDRADKKNGGDDVPA